jgi:hypothetical protein
MGALRKLRRASNCFSLLNQYVADSYVSDDAGENYACNTLAFKMTRFLCVPLIEIRLAFHPLLWHRREVGGPREEGGVY